MVLDAIGEPMHLSVGLFSPTFFSIGLVLVPPEAASHSGGWRFCARVAEGV